MRQYWKAHINMRQYVSICANMRQYASIRMSRVSICANMPRVNMRQYASICVNTRQYASICVNMGGQYGGVRKRNICCPAILTNSKVQKI